MVDATIINVKASKLYDYSDFVDGHSYKIDSKGVLYDLSVDDPQHPLRIRSGCEGIYGLNDDKVLGKIKIDGNDLIINFENGSTLRVEDYYEKNGKHVFKYLGSSYVSESGKVDCLDLVENSLVWDCVHKYVPTEVIDESRIGNLKNFNDIIDLSGLVIGTDLETGKKYATNLKGKDVYQIKINTNKGDDFVTGSEISDIVNTGEGNDHVEATVGGDTYTLGKGENTLHYSRALVGADDVVKLTKGEELDVYVDRLGHHNFNVGKQLEIVGNDVVLKDNPNRAKLQLEITIPAGTVYDSGWVYGDGTDTAKFGNESAPTVLTFTLEEYGYNEATYSNWEEADKKLVWRCTEPYGNFPGTTVLKYLWLDTTDIVNGLSIGGQTVDNASMKLYSVDTKYGFAKTEIADILEWYKNNISTDSEYFESNQGLLNYFAQENTVTFKDYAKGNSKIADVLVNGVDLEDVLYTVAMDPEKTSYTGTRLHEVYNAQPIDYYLETSPSKIKINSGAGEDTIITGSFANYTINAGNDKNKVIINSVGTNKVTTGNDYDEFVVNHGINTINSGKGSAEFFINGGENKITTGKGYYNYFNIDCGENTIKSTSSYNRVEVEDSSTNNITTGSADDFFGLEHGFNTINSGAGDDDFFINGGTNIIKSNGGDNFFDIDTGDSINTITTGKGADEFNIATGNNTIKSGAGDDIFTIKGGKNVIDAGAGDDTFVVSSELNHKRPNLIGGAGNDTYDLLRADLEQNQIIITDKSGNDTVMLDDLTDYMAYFDVSIKVNKTDAEGNVTKYTIKSTSSDLILTKDDKLDAGLLIENGLSKKGVCSIEHFEGKVADGEQIRTSISADTVNAIKESVAVWLASAANTTGYTSALEIFTNCHDADILNGLAGAYTSAQSGSEYNIFDIVSGN